jgi:hypothetical protein
MKFRIGIGICAAFALVAVLGPLLVPDPNRTSPDGLLPPSAAHPFGTTNIGQDVLGQVIAGTTGSVIIGGVAGALTVALSMLFGIGGAFLGGRWDELSSLVSNVFLVIPGLPLLIIVTDYVESRDILVIALVIALVSWAGAARVLRAQTLSVRSRDYVDAARVAGESKWRLMLREILRIELQHVGRAAEHGQRVGHGAGGQRADPAEVLGQDQLRIEPSQRSGVELVHRQAAGSAVTHHGIDGAGIEPRRQHGVDDHRAPLADAGGLVALERDGDELRVQAQGTDDLRGGRQQGGDPHASVVISSAGRGSARPG